MYKKKPNRRIHKSVRKFFKKDETGKMVKQQTGLEKEVANILRKIGVNFKEEYPINYQNKKMSTTKIYDFFCYSEDKYCFLIEAMGDHWHGASKLLEEKKGTRLSTLVKKNMRNDRLKAKIAKEKKIPLLWIWETDVNERPNFVISQIQEMIKSQSNS